MSGLAESRVSRLASVASLHTDTARMGVQIMLSGHVQGVGFRPFVYRLATEHGIGGQVQNRLGEVAIHAYGSNDSMQRFAADLIAKAPPLSRPCITSMEAVTPQPGSSFSIAASAAATDARVFVPPDYFMCDDCRDELQDPGDRRFGYPFINCTQCGPRYTLIQSLPYDRENTSMQGFDLCDACQQEYENPLDRRFHAEPVACPTCGPQLTFEVAGERLAGPEISLATNELRNGGILAVKGIGGYHLVCDASNEDAVARLRQRKNRPDKPLAVMFPLQGDDGLNGIRRHAKLLQNEAEMLRSPIRPIVLITRKALSSLADNIAPGLREIGAFLPYSPLHQLLLADFGGPLVATSGNISGEPVLTDNREASQRLQDIADAFLHHDRPIVRPADDPVFRRLDGALRPLRMGRGCAPVELEMPWRQPEPLLAVGGQMKGAVALSFDDRVVISPHIGEMDSPRSLAVFMRLAEDLQDLYGVQAKRIVCDRHSGYTTHRWGKQQSLPVSLVWHHQAHASALAAEFGMPGQWLVFTWDGVGLGEDGTLWGGEALLGQAGDWRRVASLRPFRLPGGERAGREPWRSAAALHWECGRSWIDSPDDTGIALAGWEQQINSPTTSAAGRLFDAAAAMICGPLHTSFEAQGPMLLESLCQEPGTPVALPLQVEDDGMIRSDWEPLLDPLTDTRIAMQTRAEMFHASLAHALLQQAVYIRETQGVDRIGLCGGVFQNRILTEEASALLRQNGFSVYLPQNLPVNDAGLCFGQAAHIAALSA